MKGYIEVGNDYPVIEEGAKVYVNPNYVREGENCMKYFIVELSKGYALLADNKRDLNAGKGYIFSVWDIDRYEDI